MTEFLYGRRSREAARALLAQRHLEQQYTKHNGPQRVSPCNPSTCDFWPHCAHRDGIYTTTTGNSTRPSTNCVPPSTLRLSQSYPNSVNHKERTARREASRNGYRSTRSSPASLERMDVSPTKRNPKRFNSLAMPKECRGVIGTQSRQHTPLHKETASASQTEVSPIEVNNLLVNKGKSSVSSSSSDVCDTTCDRTKSVRNTKNPTTSNSPVRPGSAPAQRDRSTVDSQQRSLSLPKSFQSEHYRSVQLKIK